MILLFSGIHSLSLQYAYFPLSVSLNFHSTSSYKKNLLSKYCFTFPELILSSCSWSSVCSSQVARVLCLWVLIYTRFLEEGSMSTSEPSSFLLFIVFLVFLVATLGSLILRRQCPNSTPSISTFWIHFQFHLFFTLLSMVTESWQTWCFFFRTALDFSNV